MNRYSILLVSLCFIFSACSSAPKSQKQATSSDPSYLKLQVYGNWCGLDYPKNLESLSTPPPTIDSLDAACKRHDYCYLEKGQFSCECDKTIVDEIDQALLLNEIKGNSRHVARSIRTHFQGSPCQGDSRGKALPSHLLHRVYHNVKGAVGGLVNKVWPSEQADTEEENHPKEDPADASDTSQEVQQNTSSKETTPDHSAKTAQPD